MNEGASQRRFVNVCISLGANLGDREGTIARALEMIGATPAIDLKRVSSFWLTDPVGVVDQPEFVNAAAVLDSELGPRELLDRFLAIERELGRERRERWREREIDIDILLFDDRVVNESDLKIPHPEMHRRAFVLIPLCEIAPDRVHPLLHKTIAELLQGAPDVCGVRRAT